MTAVVVTSAWIVWPSAPGPGPLAVVKTEGASEAGWQRAGARAVPATQEGGASREPIVEAPWVKTQAQDPVPPEPQADPEWPLHRGNPQMTGFHPGKLASRLKLLAKVTVDEGSCDHGVVIRDRTVYAASSFGTVVALSLDDGRQVWRRSTDLAVTAPPTVHQDLLLLAVSFTGVIALDRTTGKELRRSPVIKDKLHGCPQVVLPSAGNREAVVVVGSYDQFTLWGFSLADLTARSRFRTDKYLYASASTADGLAIFGGCDRFVRVVEPSQGEETLSFAMPQPVGGEVAVAWPYVYAPCGDNQVGGVACYDIGKNRHVWLFKDCGPAFSGPALGPGCVVVGSRDRHVYCLDRQEGVQRWAFTTNGKVDSSPAVVDGKVVVGSSDGWLYLIDLAKGDKLWSYEIGQPITGDPAVAHGRVAVGGNDGCVYLFGPE